MHDLIVGIFEDTKFFIYTLDLKPEVNIKSQKSSHFHSYCGTYCGMYFFKILEFNESSYVFLSGSHMKHNSGDRSQVSETGTKSGVPVPC